MAANNSELADGDTGFSGINMRLDPASLQPGVASGGENCRFRNGIAESRLGVMKPAWCNKITPSLTDDDIQPFNIVHGVGVFRDPDSLEYIIFAAEGDVYWTRQGNEPRKLTMPTGVKINTTVTFTQAFNKLIMWRGRNKAPLTLTTIDLGFDYMIPRWVSSTTYVAENEVSHGPWAAVTSADFTQVMESVPPGADPAEYSIGDVAVTMSSDHGYEVGDEVTVRGANESAYNGTHTVSYIFSSTVFWYKIYGSNPTADPATGTITISRQTDYWGANASPNTPSAGEEPGSASTKWTQQSDIMPNSDAAIYIQNRMAVITTYDQSTFGYASKPDYVFFSDILDEKHTYFSQQLRINQGDDSILVDLVKMNENQILAFKDKNVSLLTGIVVGDGNALGQSLAQQTLIGNYGLAARGAAVMVGTDCYFYASRRGIVSITQTEQNKARGVDVPLSEAIQPIIDRVDPRHEDKIRLAFNDNKLYAALPLDDGSSGNSAIVVYDFIQSQWQSLDTGTAIRPKEFFVSTYNGAQRLFFTGEDGFISLMEESHNGDDVADSESDNKIGRSPVEFKLTTRGYHSQDLWQRFFKTASIGIATNRPKYTIKLLTDGVNETQTLVADQEKSRTAYYRPWNAEAWNENNASDDHGTPYRQDYSVAFQGSGVRLTQEDFSLIQLEDGSGAIREADYVGVDIGSGIKPWRFQETLEPFRLSVREGRYGQIEISNSQGQIKVKQAVLTTSSGSRGISAKA